MKNSSLHLQTKWLLIDGFNLIYKFEHLHSLMNTSRLHEAMEGLLVQLDSFENKTGKVITVVFDGKKREGVNTQHENYRNLSVVYSLDKTADDIIMKHIKTCKTPADITVITSDKQIVSFVKRRGSKVMLSENFEKLLSATLNNNKVIEPEELPEKQSDVELSTEEISFWEKMFKR